MNEDQALPASPVLPRTFDGAKTIQFQCRKGIACWNACCSNIDISLTPYDILRLKQRLGMGSGEFLQKYTVPYEIEKDGVAGVKLRPVDNGTACRFMTAEGCSVYEDRPTACRYYPVALLSLRRQDESSDRDSYALVKEAHCLGHQEPRRVTVDDYRREQGLVEYDALARGWRQLILKKKSSGPSIGKPSVRSRQLFFMACYDLDRFRAFVASDGFNELYDLAPDTLRTLLSDDTELMLFGFRFLMQVLFGDELIPMRSRAVAQRRERSLERLQRMEREAAAARRAEQDEMYEDLDE